MKIVVNGMVWMQYSDIADHLDKLRKELTVRPNKMSGAEDILLYRNGKKAFAIPRGFYLKMRSRGHLESLKVADGRPISVETTFKAEGPFAEQAQCIETCMKHVEDNAYGGFILRAGCGWGKSSVALEVARRIGLRTMIIVHKGFLMKQWADRIKLLMPDATVGYVQQDSFDLTSDFVIGMVHSLADASKYPAELLPSFGTVIFDEVHRSAAHTWSNVISLFPARWRIGLTATPRRKDGAEKVFYHHIGQIIFTATTRSMPFTVKRLRTHVRLEKSQRSVGNHAILNQIASDQQRNMIVISTAVEAVMKGRKVLVVGDRIDHLSHLAVSISSMLMGRGVVCRIGAYTGQWFGVRNSKRTKINQGPEELALAETAQVIVATRQMVEEGLDIPAIDVIIGVTPMSDVEQMVGRARRWCLPQKEKCEHFCKWRAGTCQGKPRPIIVDLIDDGVWPSRKSGAREKFYASEMAAEIASSKG